MKLLRNQSKKIIENRRKLITVFGQNPHIEETEDEKGSLKLKKRLKQNKEDTKTQSRPKYSQNWNSAK
jgi:hypothetical protein